MIAASMVRRPASARLVACNGMIEQAGRRLCLAGANGVVAQSFYAIHINRIISDYANVNAAEKSFRQA
jgi:hypothetical protein